MSDIDVRAELAHWIENVQDADLAGELTDMQAKADAGDEAAMTDAFFQNLSFGTAGLRGVIGAGTNRMNVYVVSQATQGLANWVKTQGSSIKEELERIYAEYGRYLNKVDSFEFPGLSGMDKMAGIMANLRANPPKDFDGDAVVKTVDYKKPEETGLPAANVLIYTLESGATVVVRPSGTEPKIKTYFTTLGKDLAEAQAQKDALAAAIEPILK